MNKYEYLIYFLNKDYVPDILIISAESANDAWIRVEKLPKVEQVLSVWSKVL